VYSNLNEEEVAPSTEDPMVLEKGDVDSVVIDLATLLSRLGMAHPTLRWTCNIQIGEYENAKL
jgi:hypothetical protein